MAQTDAMLAELRRMNTLLALVAIKGVSTQEATIMLNNAGYGMMEIARLLDRKPSAVSMTLVRYRQSKNRKAAKKTAGHMSETSNNGATD